MAMQPVSVTQLTQYIKLLLDRDEILSQVCVRGELSNFKAHSSGHLYFTLKDEGAVISCVMFRSDAMKLRFRPESGMKVILYGRVSLFPKSGQYQIYVTHLQPDGVGALAVAFEQLKHRLHDEGLFDQSHKKALPIYPQRVALVTSPTGAAVRDMIRILGRRWPMAEVLVCPVRVQGEGAAEEIADMLDYLDKHALADVIITGRGGGSMEDLWAFNDERLAREIAASAIPVISAVGHESDFTICDFVADRRAPTPSAAAEIAVPDMGEILRGLASLRTGLQTSMQKLILQERRMLNQFTQSRVFARPEQMLDNFRMRLDEREANLGRAVGQTLLQKKQSTARVAGKLEALNPLAVLSRGYATVSREGISVTSIEQINDNDTLDIRFADGSVRATVSQRKDS